jgi:N-acetylmuramic acid 6-phosphate etherase
MRKPKINLESLVTEQRNPASMDIDRKSMEEILRIINAEDKKVPIAVEKEIPNIVKAVDMITEILRKGGKLFYIGAGSSGRLGVLDAAEISTTYGTDPKLVQGIIAGGWEALWRSVGGMEDDREAGVSDLLAGVFSLKDVLVGLSASGRTPYVVAALKEARKMGAKTMSVTCNPNSEMARMVDIAITPVVGPEVVTGSTRMKAGTAQKLVLNMLSTATMIKLGKVRENFTVDLKPVNEKLRERAKRIVMALTGVDYETADKAFEEAQRDAKTAIVMIKAGVSHEKAVKALEKARGMVWKAIEIAQSVVPPYDNHPCQ